jgi:hypothetical protein
MVVEHHAASVQMLFRLTAVFDIAGKLKGRVPRGVLRRNACSAPRLCQKYGMLASEITLLMIVGCRTIPG